MSPKTRVNTEELEEWKDKTDRSSIRHFFVRISAQELAHKQRTDFRKYGRKLRKERRKRGGAARTQKQKQHKLDRTIGLTTVNVRGLATKLHELGGKLQGLKEQHARGQRDVSFIQETHLYPEELAAAKAKHVALWGFKRSQADKFSFWSSGTERSRSAGVAILVNPYGAVKEAKPWQEHQWSEHVMMITGKITGKLFLFVNVYAPSLPAERIKFYHHLQQLCPPDGAEVVIGGDFNCVLRRDVDRIGSNFRDDEGAMELETIINKLGLVDAGFYNMPQGMRQSDITKYANEHHTHRHKAADGSIGTSRLDRWYIGATAKRLLRGVVTEESPCNADHRAVLLELHAPSGCTRMRKRAKIYPAPNYVQAATHSMITLKLKELQNEALKWRRGEAATKWDAFKQTIKEAMTHLKKAARARMNNGFRQKIQRVKQKLGKCDYGSQAENEKRRDLLDTLHKLQEERRVLRRRNLIEQNAWSSKKTTRHFFKRICTKFGDNVIPKLTQSATGPQRGVHEKANILADSWEPIFNGASAVDESIEEYVGRLHSRWKTIDLSDIDEAITEDEVAAAINKSKRGKACGPDDLGNEWYQDHCDNVVPILTKLYNESMEGEQIPTTFVEAFIFSITKGGDTSNPLNYRPIALLNTDYKILTRILAWRVRKHITKIVHSTQCGFVPGRTIHEAIDMLEAIKLRCREGKTLSKAQVLLLDFAKAYDSLDRAFLLEVLRRKGFPPKFCRLVEAIHTDTSVRFMANGELSRSVQVTRGIRQGCPLAPLLFIIAVDLLYDEIEMTHDIVGIKMDDRGEVSEIRAAGYADDTAIYIQHIRMQGAAIQAVARFSAVSGLNLNVKKSVAINLGCSSTTAEKEDASSVQTETEVMARDSTRYLGHVAGAGNTTEEAWSKALGALRVRLALAETKTNTPAQRAAIAAAIVIPKLLFVARHAWPTDTIVKKADKCIKNFVWRSYFAEPEGAVSGWVKGVKDWESQI